MPVPAHTTNLIPEVVIAEHGGAVWGLCRRCCPEPDDAFQEIWARVLGALRGFDPSGPATLRGWILTIANRHLVDRHRRRVVRGDVVELGDVPWEDPRDETIDRDRAHRRLEAALAALPGDQRRVVTLHHVHGMDLETIAATEDVPVGTVKSRLFRGRARLAEIMGVGR